MSAASAGLLTAYVFGSYVAALLTIFVRPDGGAHHHEVRRRGIRPQRSRDDPRPGHSRWHGTWG